jgi:phospholipid transport system substrate-binding protein
MTRRFNIISVALSVALGALLVGAPSTQAQATAQAASRQEFKAAEKYIRTKHNDVRTVLRKPDSPKRAAELTEVLGEFLDYEAIARKSLDTEWEKHSKAEQDQFVSLLRQLVERQYQRNMETTLDYDVKWVGSEELPSNGALVKSSARSKTKKRTPAVEIDYSMSPHASSWSVFDITTDGVSLVKNYRRQFRRIITSEGWDGLIGRMERKLNASPDDEVF